MKPREWKLITWILRVNVAELVKKTNDSDLREIEYLQALTSGKPKDDYLFSKEEVIPAIQKKLHALIKRKAGWKEIPDKLPNEVLAVQHSIAFHITERLKQYPLEDKGNPTLTQMKKFFETLQIANTDPATDEGKLFVGLQDSVIAAAEFILPRVAEIEYAQHCKSPVAAFDFLTMLENTEIFRKMGLKDRLLSKTRLLYPLYPLPTVMYPVPNLS